MNNWKNKQRKYAKPHNLLQWKARNSQFFLVSNKQKENKYSI